jgi:phosphatidylserine/phosphatidylglycerophosphate/cardiolipin synthase-like enzyme
MAHVNYPRRPSGSARHHAAAWLAAAIVPLLAACGSDPSPAAAAAAGRSAPWYPSQPGPVVPLGRDTLRVLPRGSTAFPVILELIAGAHASVEVEMYEFGRGDLAAALVQARSRRVAVTVIDDPSVDVTRDTATRLRAAGVDVIDYPVRKGMIDHVKLIVVDHHVAVVGGINWGATSDLNHDVDAEVTGPAAANLERVFVDDLVTCGRVTAETAVQPDSSMFVASTLPGADIRPLALHLIDSARTTLDLELYVLTDTGIVHAVERAHDRGVRVRVLLDPGQRPSDGAAAELTAAGVEVRLYRSHGEKLHAKVGIADGRDSLLGSANWTTSGFERNHELDIEIPDAPAVAAQLTAMADADWADSAP